MPHPRHLHWTTMTPWKRALREGLVTGSIASITSALALALAGRRENGHAAAPVNAVSHWVWDRESLVVDRPTARHTVTGLLVHHGASVFWGTMHARAWGLHERNKRPLPAAAGAAVACAVACFVDYHLTPRRLTPGFEHRLSRHSLALVYASFGVGLALGTALLRRRAAPASRPRRAAPSPRRSPAS
jgi:hypothetical protein